MLYKQKHKGNTVYDIAAVWLNKICRTEQIIPKYEYIKVKHFKILFIPVRWSRTQPGMLACVHLI